MRPPAPPRRHRNNERPPTPRTPPSHTTLHMTTTTPTIVVRITITITAIIPFIRCLTITGPRCSTAPRGYSAQALNSLAIVLNEFLKTLLSWI